MSVTEKPKMPDNGCGSEAMAACEDLAAVFRALGHPARLAIIKRLAAQKEACCGEIVSALPLAQSTVSQHLQVLKDAGLLACDNRGRSCHYLLNRERLAQAARHSREFWERLEALTPEPAAE